MCVRDSLNTEGTRRKSDRVDANVAGVCGRVEHNPGVDVCEGGRNEVSHANHIKLYDSRGVTLP